MVARRSSIYTTCSDSGFDEEYCGVLKRALGVVRVYPVFRAIDRSTRGRPMRRRTGEGIGRVTARTISDRKRGALTKQE